MPSIMACIIHADTRRLSAHARCHRAGCCHHAPPTSSPSSRGNLSKLVRVRVRVRVRGRVRAYPNPNLTWPPPSCAA